MRVRLRRPAAAPAPLPSRAFHPPVGARPRGGGRRQRQRRRWRALRGRLAQVVHRRRVGDEARCQPLCQLRVVLHGLMLREGRALARLVAAGEGGGAAVVDAQPGVREVGKGSVCVAVAEGAGAGTPGGERCAVMEAGGLQACCGLQTLTEGAQASASGGGMVTRGAAPTIAASQSCSPPVRHTVSRTPPLPPVSPAVHHAAVPDLGVAWPGNHHPRACSARQLEIWLPLPGRLSVLKVRLPVRP